jgi:prolyl-tRNA synthetase
MRTRLFLRTTEFLWQEGHTCHETQEEAEEETIRMIRIYKDFCENILAMPVIVGLKTESEKFAGAVRTYCIEAMMQDKKALQAGTSHNLGQNFAKAFETKFQDRQGNWQYVFQTSWGVSTRLIGGLIMTHSDDKGLVLPPKIASIHVVIIPVIKNNPDDIKVFELADKVASMISLNQSIKVKVDRDTQHSPGWKFHEYELIGVPLRIEIGPKDVEKNQVVVVRRDLGNKVFVPINDVVQYVSSELEKMQTELLNKARERLKNNSFLVDDYEDFKKKIEEPGGFIHAHCSLETNEAEQRIKEETKATIRCIPLDEADRLAPANEQGRCIITGKPTRGRVIFAKSY